jgi:hypothetical protein
MTNTKMREISPLAVRMPPSIRARILELASQNRRSINAEILFRLEQAIFDPHDMKKGSEVTA